MGSVLMGILRDNSIVNPIFREVLKFVAQNLNIGHSLTNKYRIYGNVLLSICGISLHIHSEADDHIANEIYYGHGYESNEFLLIKLLTKSSKFFVDVGANTGIFSIFCALCHPHIKVYGFEPHPSNFSRFQYNVRLNDLDKRIESCRYAVGSNRNQIEFTVPADLSISATSSGNTAYAENFHNISYRRIKVDQVCLDDFFMDVPLTSRDLIKIDVEYYELEVLRGAKSTLSEKRPMIMIEILHYEDLVRCHAAMEGTIDRLYEVEVFRFLRNLGYFCYALDSSGIRLVETISDQKGRNYLFLPFEGTRESYGYHEIPALQMNS